VHGTQSVLKARVHRTGVNEAGQAQLTYAAQPLKVWMMDNIMKKVAGYTNKPIYRIINDFFLIHFVPEFVT
jgi:hypothetical protein